MKTPLVRPQSVAWAPAVAVALLVVGAMVARPVAAQDTPTPPDPTPAEPAAEPPADAGEGDDESQFVDAETFRAELDALRAEMDERLAEKEAAIEELRGELDDRAAETDEMLEDLQTLLDDFDEQMANLEDKVARVPEWDLSGFAEFRFQAMLADRASPLFGHWRNAGFSQSDFRVTLGANPDPQVRLLAEVRMVYNNSEETYVQGEFVDRFGFTVERLYAHFTILDEFQIVAGIFLTPFGIYAEDHGAPAYVSALLPLSYFLEFYPAQMTGIDITGKIRASDFIDVEYHGIIANGQGSFPQIFASIPVGVLTKEYANPADSPAFAAALAVTLKEVGPIESWQFKAGYYNAWEQDQEFVQGRVDWRLQRHHNTFVFASKLEIEGLFVQAEWVKDFRPERARQLSAFPGPAGFTIVGPDLEFREDLYTWYVMAGYEIKDLNLTIWASFEQVAGKNGNPATPPTDFKVNVYRFGARWRHSDGWLIVKYESLFSQFDAPLDVNNLNWHVLSVTIFFK